MDAEDAPLVRELCEKTVSKPIAIYSTELQLNLHWQYQSGMRIRPLCRVVSWKGLVWRNGKGVNVANAGQALRRCTSQKMIVKSREAV